MLTRDDNDRITRVGPGTPMGELMRRYWMPTVLSRDIAEPGGAPVRVGLLGESLVAFRSPDGHTGLIGEHCLHRGASLVYGRNEAQGLRCLYHGWQFSVDGDVLDTPAEPQTSRMKTRLRHIAYPTIEAGGIVWAYLGPAAHRPVFPRYPWMSLPPDRLLVVKMFQDCNYLQGVEGDLDPAHPNYLHQDFDLRGDSWDGAGWNSIVRMMDDGSPQIHCEDTPYLMRVVARRRTRDPSQEYIRTVEWVAPFYCLTASGAHESRVFKAWLPVDDDSCYTFYIHYDTERALDVPAIYQNWNHRADGPDYRTPHTLGNMHLQSRADMQARNFSGISGAAIQDRAVQESMGKRYDRTREHLGRSDAAVIYYRRRLLALTRAVEVGETLPAHDPGLSFDLYTASCTVPSSASAEEAIGRQQAEERRTAMQT